MPALVAGIHVFLSEVQPRTWMAGTSPAMTIERSMTTDENRQFFPAI